jgi:2-polyprenyl-6-methoxyphenol hydroxylase-like FAD-dependent oxidoreductase
LSRNTEDWTQADVVVVGAGLAGTTAAAVLGREHRVILVDPRATCPPVFKAEKIEAKQAAILRELDLLQHLLPHAARVTEIWSAYAGHLFQRSEGEQYGLRYDRMVNAIAEQIPASVKRCPGRAVRITNSPTLQTVHLAEGGEIRCRLVILACGFHSELLGPMGFRRVVVQRDQSITFGFGLEREPGSSRFHFDALTYHPKLGGPELIDFLTLFAFPEGMRANLFAFRPANDPWVRAFITDPTPVLDRVFPRLRSLIGPYAIRGRVEAAGSDLVRTEGGPVPGVVLIGDASQTVCPSTSTGVSKILTDVHLLTSEYVPRWLAGTGMGVDKIESFVIDARKIASDESSLRSGTYRRCLSTERSLKWSVHRKKLEMRMGLSATRLRLRGAV